MTVTYRDAGVNIDTGDQFVNNIKELIQRTRRPEVLGSIGGFSGLFSFPARQFENPVLAAATDGVGTKLKVAMLVGNHKTVGVDLVAMCVNDVVVSGAEPLFFMDYFATGRLDPEQGQDIIAGVVDGCQQAGCALLGGETAEMPGFYSPGDYDLAGFALGVAEHDKLLGSHRVKEGDVLLGLASNGLHSNGFSLVRRVLLTKNQAALNNVPPGLSVPLKEELLRPTRIYVKVVLEIIKQAEIHAFAHITGGGLKGNLPRVIPDHLAVRLDRGSWPELPIFQLVQAAAQVDYEEMLNTFNLGVGMVAVVNPDSVNSARQTAQEHGIDCWPIGQVISRQPGESRFVLMTV